jgi:hypothetical protein
MRQESLAVFAKYKRLRFTVFGLSILSRANLTTVVGRLNDCIVSFSFVSSVDQINSWGFVKARVCCPERESYPTLHRL